jgi:hypothetical protein
MIEWLLNFGTGIPAWTSFVIAIIVGGVGVLTLYSWYKFVMAAVEKQPWRALLTRAIIRSVVFAAVIYFAFVAFGPGQPAPPMDSGEGARELIEKAPPEKSKEQIDKEAYDKQPEVLKKQDQGFAEEKEEADAYLDELRKRHENQ